ncbi:MAG: hypothetical protein QXO37_02490 [Candidatus Nitrosocaldaceae archaeon]
MRRATHNKIAKILFPNASLKQIDKINYLLDNPDELSRLISHFTNGKYELGLNKKGFARHRNVNHDLVSASIVGLMNGNVSVALLHLLVDLTSDQMNKIKILSLLKNML